MPSFFSTTSVLLLLSVLLLTNSQVSARPIIPYDGKNVHLNSQYRQHHAEFKNRARHHNHHRGEDDNKNNNDNDDEIVFVGYGEMKSHHEYTNYHPEVMISMKTDTEHVLYEEQEGKERGKYVAKEEFNNNSSSSNNGKSWRDAFLMFFVWTSDNLFWLIPFVAHSKANAVWFVVTYEALVFVGSFLFHPESTLAAAHKLNNLYGISGTIFCWVLAYSFYTQFQRRHNHTEKATSSETTNSYKDIELASSSSSSDLQVPLLEQAPAPTEDSFLNPADTVPPKWLIMTMSLVAAVDDVFFVPTMIHEDHMFTVTDMGMASLLAVLIWSMIAIVVARHYQSFLVCIPLYMIVSTYAAVMTGHSMWDFLSSRALAIW